MTKMDKSETVGIPIPAGARPLTAAQLNNIRFSVKRTILTPELIARLSQKRNDVRR